METDSEWSQKADVAAPMFFHYLGTGTLGTTDQVTDRISEEILPFDESIADEFDISPRNLFAVAEAVHHFQSACMQHVVQNRKYIGRTEKDELFDIEGDKDRLRKYVAIFNSLNTVPKSLVAELIGPDQAETVWKEWVLQRRARTEQIFPSDRLICEKYPLVQVQDDLAMFVSVHSVYEGVLYLCEDLARSSRIADKYLRNRDRCLERKAKRCFKYLFSTDDIIAHGCENETLSHEHDLIIDDASGLIVAECKASPLVEPFRDVDKSFNRMKHNFKSDTGIQGAYEQAKRLIDHIALGNHRIYVGTRNNIKEVILKRSTKQFAVCVTRDNFGIIGTDLTLLLDRKGSDHVPWVIDIWSLESMMKTLFYLGIGKRFFFEFLEERQLTHGVCFGPDELEHVGFKLYHRHLPTSAKSQVDKVLLNTNYSNIFDQAYEAERSGRALRHSIGPAFIANPRTGTVEAAWILSDRVVFRSQIHKNTRCPCGSGRKFRKCCGSKKIPTSWLSRS